MKKALMGKDAFFPMLNQNILAFVPIRVSSCNMLIPVISHPHDPLDVVHTTNTERDECILVFDSFSLQIFPRLKVFTLIRKMG